MCRIPRGHICVQHIEISDNYYQIKSRMDYLRGSEFLTIGGMKETKDT